MVNFFQILETVLKNDTRFCSKDTKTLLRNKIYESAVNMDSELIKLLLSNSETKKRFLPT
jgi:adenine-specific DNA-methyltransferase